MPGRKVVKFPEKGLLSRTAPVRKVDEGIRRLAKDMLDTMYLAEGVGLSANQIGIPKRIAVMNPTGRKADELVLVNPNIIKKEGEAVIQEGCLSMPGISSEVKRAYKIEVKFLDLEGSEKLLSAEGLAARIVQHEIDHLNGRLFVDRLSLIKRKKLIKKYQHMITERILPNPNTTKSKINPKSQIQNFGF